MTVRFSLLTWSTGTKQLLFHCPGCQFLHGPIIARGPEDEKRPLWSWNGDLDRATFSPSLLVTYPAGAKTNVCHSFIRDGRIQFLNDCTHALAGHTVDIPAWED